MTKRKNDEIAGFPIWVWIVLPVFLLAMGGGGVLLGQWLAARNINVLPPEPTTVYLPPTVTAAATFTPTPLDYQPQSAVSMDVVLLIDTTGSMGDEIAQLQNNFLVISGQIAERFKNVDVRYGLVAYRDRGDEYVTQVYDFTADVRIFQSSLNQLWAGGGGDNPEDLAAGLQAALFNLSWRGEDTVKLMFLVADAPAQLYGGYDYVAGMQEAAKRGIKIHSIASSGLDQPGEYMLRQIAQYTMGHFIFLTYDESTPTGGAPGEVRPDLNVGEPEDAQGVGEYTVEQLDELVLRLISDELAALQGQ